MTYFKESYNCGAARTGGMIIGEKYRFSILTPQLVRMEYDETGVFEDRPTQMVLNRDFPSSEFSVWKNSGGIEIETEYISIFYNEKEFSANGLTIENHSECKGIYCTWHFGDMLKENLGGTARTLDEIDGDLPLEPGILSRLQGFSVLDDSTSLLLTEDGGVEPRRQGIKDLYFFSYGYEYKRAIKDFFYLCGATPLLPRYALGNWWSRFYPYTDKQYDELIGEFEQRGIPLSVSVIDMDWHNTEIDPKDGKGWTGYTWNKNLFPNPRVFLDKLHQRGLKTTLNLHPAEGVQPHEEMYEKVALTLGKDITRHQRVPFDAGNRDFMEAYFKYLHHPREEEGVDFWWVDWQQGTTSAVSGLDPLWILNHSHFIDIARNGKRPIILSRFAGPGSHRYPIGFSGDSVISWATLQFQPYFTSTAANIGYGWWSHDIGGHAHGKRDDELQVRWLQFGVFSPIMRMHSTSNLFNSKEPWRYGGEICKIMIKFLRMRHRMIPYLYSMNWRCHTQGEQLIQPMYFEHPRDEEAYQVVNQFYFGSELIVYPITEPMDRVLMRSNVNVWLPTGQYIDVMTGVIYSGNRMVKMFRTLDHIPVLAKAGAIVPLTGKENSCCNGVDLPRQLEINIYAGANGSFELYEDDGETLKYKIGQYNLTKMNFIWKNQDSSTFEILPGEKLPFQKNSRSYIVNFNGVENNSTIQVEVNGQLTRSCSEYDEKMHRISISISDVPITSPIQFEFREPLQLAKNNVDKHIKCLLNDALIEYELKDLIFNTLTRKHNLSDVLSEMQTMNLPNGMLAEITEILCAN